MQEKSFYGTSKKCFNGDFEFLASRFWGLSEWVIWAL